MIGLNVVAPAAAVPLVLVDAAPLAVGLIGSAHALFVAPTLMPSCSLYGRVLRRFPGDPEGRVWLTIDDGPDPEDTPRVLDVLDAYGARATFFVVGERARRFPALVREVVDRGHQLGNHTMDHAQYSFWAAGPRRAARQIEDCQKVVEDAAGVRPRWFRAPVGFENPFVSAAVERLGLQTVGWSARGFDGVVADVDRVLDRLRPGLRDGAIVLAHERGRNAAGEPIAVDVLRGVLGSLAERGLRAELPPRVPATA